MLVMYFTCAKVLSNDLKGTGDMVMFVLLCKIIHLTYACQHAHNRIIMHLVVYPTVF